MGAIVLVGGLLRFATLDAKSFWRDEATTVLALDNHFGQMLAAISDTEATPPLYYVLAWLWSQPFGLGEVGLRSLSALLGTAVVPVVFAAGRDLVSRRAGLAASALAAVNPLLVWYSQEARTYSLLVLASAVAFWGFVRALDERPRGFALWGAASTVAVLSHYFAIFAFAVQVGWLAWDRYRRGAGLRPLTAAAPTLVTVVALVPLGISQTTGEHSGRATNWIADMTLISRVLEVPGTFLVGFESPQPVLVSAIACVLVVPALWVVVPALTRRSSLRVGPAVGVALAGVALPLLVALLGTNYFFYRNLLGVLVPTLVALGAGFSATRALGRSSLAGLCALSVFLLGATAWQPKYGTEDWRSAAASIGPAAEPRAIVAMTSASPEEPLAVYAGAGRMPESAAVREVVVLTSAGPPDGSARPRPPTVLNLGPGFTRVAHRVTEDWEVLVFRAAGPVRVTPATLTRAVRGLDAGSVVLLQDPSRSVARPEVRQPPDPASTRRAGTSPSGVTV